MSDYVLDKKDFYFKNIWNYAKSYGLAASLIKFKENHSDESSGEYIMLSPNSQLIADASNGKMNLQIEERISQLADKPEMIYTDFQVYKVNRENIHLAAFNAYDYMKYYEALTVSYKEKDLPFPLRCLKGDIDSIVDYSKNRTAGGSYDIDKQVDKQYTRYLKKLSKIDKEKDTFEAVHNKWKQRIWNKGEVYKDFTSMTLPSGEIDLFKKYMSEFPYCKYIIEAPSVRTNFELFYNSSGTGFKEEKDSVTKVYVHPDYKKILYNFKNYQLEAHEIDNVDKDKLVMASIADQGKVGMLTVPLKYIEALVHTLIDEGIPYSFDGKGEYRNSSFDDITLLCYPTQKNTIEQFLVKIIGEDIERKEHFIEGYQKSIVEKKEEERKIKEEKKGKKLGMI